MGLNMKDSGLEGSSMGSVKWCFQMGLLKKATLIIISTWGKKLQMLSTFEREAVQCQRSLQSEM